MVTAHSRLLSDHCSFFSGNELPTEQREAGKKLGYDKQKWDKDEKIELDDKVRTVVSCCDVMCFCRRFILTASLALASGILGLG
jgi:hypothetical protein